MSIIIWEHRVSCKQINWRNATPNHISVVSYVSKYFERPKFRYWLLIKAINIIGKYYKNIFKTTVVYNTDTLLSDTTLCKISCTYISIVSNHVSCTHYIRLMKIIDHKLASQANTLAFLRNPYLYCPTTFTYKECDPPWLKNVQM